MVCNVYQRSIPGIRLYQNNSLFQMPSKRKNKKERVGKKNHQILEHQLVWKSGFMEARVSLSHGTMKWNPRMGHLTSLQS